MNGSNQIEECDSKPFLLCADCLRKLAFYFNFDTKLEEWCEKQQTLMKEMKNSKFDREISKFETLFEKIRAAER